MKKIKFEDGYELVTTAAHFEELMDELALHNSGAAALDFETTGLDERTARVRLAQIRNEHLWFVVDFFAIGGFDKWAHHFEIGIDWIAFNAGFEYKFLAHNGAREARVVDVAHLRRATMGGDQMSFAMMLKKDLGVDLPKEEQASNWGAAKLTDQQLDYAADDAWWTWELNEFWLNKMRSNRYPHRMNAATMFDDLVQPVHGMQKEGLLLDIPRHRKLVHTWEEKRDQYEFNIREHIDKSMVQNLGSPAQWSDFLARELPDWWLNDWKRTDKSGQLAITTRDLKTQALVATENGVDWLADVLYNLADRITVTQYISNFGDKLISLAEADDEGRIHPSYNIARAITCRFSSSGPNAQQFPRDRELLGEYTSVRQSFIARYGHLMVSLDYSGIELRVLALLSGDEQLLHDVVYGNVHAETGALIVGRPLDLSVPADKETRSQAKGVNFGIIYGSGAGGLATTLRSNYAFAQDVLSAWGERYPKAFELRNTMMEEAQDTQYIPMVDGGTIHMGKRPELPKCANYPVQRAALSIMARAIIRHHDNVKAMSGSYMLSTIHDALIDEARAARAPELLHVMAKDMTDGFLDIFPDASTHRLLEGGVGPSWGKLEEMEIAA